MLHELAITWNLMLKPVKSHEVSIEQGTTTQNTGMRRERLSDLTKQMLISEFEHVISETHRSSR